MLNRTTILAIAITKYILEVALPVVIRQLVQAEDNSSPDPEMIYTRGLSTLVDALLGKTESTRNALPPNYMTDQAPVDDSSPPRLTSMTPAAIGDLYQYLRGFKLEFLNGQEILIRPCAQGRRNQGLFYTPKPIVSHIVGQTLDALQVTDSLAYLDLRLLDPAVGSGLFLEEALEQISQRVGACADEKHGRLRQIIRETRESLRERALINGITIDPSDRSAIRVHILEHCLYGVDLDPIAVRIAVSNLQNAAAGNMAGASLVKTNLKVGNSLIGRKSLADRVLILPGPRKAVQIGLFDETGAVRRENSQDPSRSKEQETYDWPLEFPEIFQGHHRGFDAVVGNPPYEIVSVKESGIRERSIQQAYYKQAFKTCKGKINLYRLMLERGLDLLRRDGALGFIVPATLLSDSTALSLRKMILETSEVIDAVVIPEKAKIFPHVTQALLILVCRKGRKSSAIAPVIWNGNGPIPRTGGVGIPTSMVKKSGWRIPIIGSYEEKTLMEILLNYPPIRGNEHVAAAGRVHQGEINLTVHREFLTASPTGYPLIRGEHVAPFRVIHPSSRNNRLDWMLPRFLAQVQSRALPVKKHSEDQRSGSRHRGVPWQDKRIALARVVNMATGRRLKAALVQPGCFLGDMTNFIANVSVPIDYLVGLLNSSLLNWRIKLTSTNNYLSADEIEALPVPRIDYASISSDDMESGQQAFAELLKRPQDSVARYLHELNGVLGDAGESRSSAMSAKMVEWVAQLCCESSGGSLAGTSDNEALGRLLDALTLKVYAVESLDAAKIFSS